MVAWRGKAAGGGKEALQPVNEVSRAERSKAGRDWLCGNVGDAGAVLTPR